MRCRSSPPKRQRPPPDRGHATQASVEGYAGGAVRSKTPVAMVNEVLCKIICHNILRAHSGNA